MPEILYSKFSKDRQKKFQIATMIVEENGEKSVIKKAMHKEGDAHVRKMVESRELLSELFINSGVEMCPCKEEKGQVRFLFVEGESLEERIHRHSEANDYEALKEDYRFLAKIIFSVKGMHTFESSPAFEEIFGFPKFKEAQHSADISNVDMIPANLLLGKKCVLADYEWVFFFEIPLEFIYARSIFLQEAVCNLDKSQLEELYAIGRVDMEEVPVYYQMEVNFQEYVAGKGEKYALSHLYQKMHCKSYPVSEWDYKRQFFSIGIEGDTGEEWEEISYEETIHSEIKRTIQLKANKYTRLRIKPVDSKSIIKIRKLVGKKEKQEVSLNFTHNANLVIIDDYYFTEPPVLEIALDGCEEIEFDYLVYRRNDGVIDQMVTFIQNEKALKDEKQMLTEKNAAHEARIAKLGEELNDLQATVEYQAEKIRQLENLKVYKMYQKVRKIVKRGN